MIEFIARRRLPLMIAAGCLAAALWYFPFFKDALLHGAAWECGGRLTYSSADISAAGISGRHCKHGGTLSQTEAGYLHHFEFARDGWLLVYGPGQFARTGPRSSDAPVAVRLALLRTPGEDGRWYCARGGQMIFDESDRSFNRWPGGADLTGVSALAPGPAASARETQVGELPRRMGSGCDQNYRRCHFTFSADEIETQRLFVRTVDPMTRALTPIAFGFLVREDGRVPEEVALRELAIARAAERAGATIRVLPAGRNPGPGQVDPQLAIDRLGPELICEAAAPDREQPRGQLSIRW